MSKRLYTADVNLQADTLFYTYGCGREGEHAPSRATAEQKINIKKISGLANKVSKALSGCDVSNLKTLGGTLYDWLIPEKFASVITPSQDALELPHQPSRDNFVFYLLNPKIAWIPWELLYDGDAFLCRRFCVSRSLVKTGYEFELAQRRLDALRRPGVIVLLGETSGLNTDKEIEEILRILTPVVGNNIIVRDAVNKQETVEHLKENYDICHFIGHGVFSAKNRKKSGWRLRDGTVLTCSDIEGVKSPKAVFPRLIIANSCESARSIPPPSNAQKYVTSLYRSFLSMGVPQYIGTIARIPDDVSQLFTSAFYTSLASGNPVGEAVFQAREAASAGPGWGYYVHYGDPGFPLLASTGSQSHPQGVAIPTCERPALEVIIARRRQPDTVHVRRYDQLRLVRSRIQRFAQGYSDAVLFEGEAGVGKSVFLTDILNEVRSTVPYALCGIASCKRSNLKREYVPVKQLLQSLLAPGGTPATMDDRVLRGILRSSQLFYLCRPDLLFAGDWPQVSRRFVSRPPVQGIEAVDHEHLLRELKAFIDDLCQAHSVVVALEDLQWADEASLDLLFSLMSVAERRSPVLTLGTMRTHKIPASLGSRLNEAYQRGVASLSLDFDRIDRRGNREAEAFVIRYLRKILPISSQFERPSFDLVNSLLDYTAGNSFLLSELVRVLGARNQIFRIPGMFYQNWQIRDGVASLITMPIRGWLKERIGELDADLESILMHASIEGKHFSLDLLSKLLGRNSDDVLKSLEELEQNFKLIVPSLSRADLWERYNRVWGLPYEASEQEKSFRFLFRHEMFVWYFRSLLTFEEKKRLHRIAGEYLEELYKNPSKGDPELRTVAAATLGDHFTEAGDYTKAIDYLLSAAKECRYGRHITEAICLYRKALVLCTGIHSSFKERIEAALVKLRPFEWLEPNLRTHNYGLSASQKQRQSAAYHEDWTAWRKLWDPDVK